MTGPPAPGSMTLLDALRLLSEIVDSNIADFLEDRDDDALRLDLKKAEGKLWLLRRLEVGPTADCFEIQFNDKILALSLLMELRKRLDAVTRREDRPAFRPRRLEIPDFPHGPRRRAPAVA